MSISLVPYVIISFGLNWKHALELQTSISLLEKMIDDFNSRWGEEMRFSYETRRSDRNHQVGIHAYSYWAMVLDPRTKKYLPKILTNAREVWTLQNENKESCLEVARGTRNPENQQLIAMEGMQRAENHPEQRRNRTAGAASFFPECSDEDMEDEVFLRELSGEDLISNEIRRYQSDNY